LASRRFNVAGYRALIAALVTRARQCAHIRPFALLITAMSDAYKVKRQAARARKGEARQRRHASPSSTSDARSARTRIDWRTPPWMRQPIRSASTGSRPRIPIPGRAQAEYGPDPFTPLERAFGYSLPPFADTGRVPEAAAIIFDAHVSEMNCRRVEGARRSARCSRQSRKI
jgi:hypothetical protein